SPRTEKNPAGTHRLSTRQRPVAHTGPNAGVSTSLQLPTGAKLPLETRASLGAAESKEIAGVPQPTSQANGGETQHGGLDQNRRGSRQLRRIARTGGRG